MVEQPFASTAAPVIRDASSDARKSTTAAISPGAPWRPTVIPRVSAAMVSGHELAVKSNHMTRSKFDEVGAFFARLPGI
jgi:hypothetical protein